MSTTVKATRKLGHGDDWNVDEGVTVHATRYGTTVCGRQVGTFRTGWLGPLPGYTVTCKRCLAADRAAANRAARRERSS